MVAGQVLVIIAAALILLAYRYDTQRRLALLHLLAAVGCGFGGMWLIGQVDDWLVRSPCVASVLLVKAAAIALAEEGGKLATILLLAITLFRRKLVTPLDGLLIGQMVGLGMALSESTLYLKLEPQTLQTLGMEVVRLFAHSLMAGVVGFGVGCLKISGPTSQRLHRLLLCVGLTTAIHFAWNAIAYGQRAGLPAHLIPMLLMLTLMLLWKMFCTIAQRHADAGWPITTAPLRTA